MVAREFEKRGIEGACFGGKTVSYISMMVYMLGTNIVSFACGGLWTPLPDVSNGWPGMMRSPTVAHIFDFIGELSLEFHGNEPERKMLTVIRSTSFVIRTLGLLADRDGVALAGLTRGRRGVGGTISTSDGSFASGGADGGGVFCLLKMIVLSSSASCSGSPLSESGDRGCTVTSGSSTCSGSGS